MTNYGCERTFISDGQKDGRMLTDSISPFKRLILMKVSTTYVKEEFISCYFIVMSQSNIHGNANLIITVVVRLAMIYEDSANPQSYVKYRIPHILREKPSLPQNNSLSCFKMGVARNIESILSYRYGV